MFRFTRGEDVNAIDIVFEGSHEDLPIDRGRFDIRSGDLAKCVAGEDDGKTFIFHEGDKEWVEYAGGNSSGSGGSTGGGSGSTGGSLNPLFIDLDAQGYFDGAEGVTGTEILELYRQSSFWHPGISVTPINVVAYVSTGYTDVIITPVDITVVDNSVYGQIYLYDKYGQKRDPHIIGFMWDEDSGAWEDTVG